VTKAKRTLWIFSARTESGPSLCGIIVKVFPIIADSALATNAERLERPLLSTAQARPIIATRLKTKPYLRPNEAVALALLLATPLQAQSQAGGYSNAVGLGAMGGIILLLLAWSQSLRWQLRGVLSSAQVRSNESEAVGASILPKDNIDLQRTETEFARERDLLTTLLDNTPDLIYFKDLQSRFVRVSRSKMEWALALARNHHQTSSEDSRSADPPNHLRGPTEFAQYLLGKTDFDLYAEDRARSAFEDEQDIIRTGNPLVGKMEKTVSPDGQSSWLVTTKVPWRGHDGTIIGTFGISKDVTFIKEAESKLESSHKQLLEASRLAGMAEVATTVLHNVGNVLNSVNISASIVAEKVKNSEASNLAQVAQMLREHADDLPAFLAHDPKGSKLPAYFAILAERRAAEQKEVLAELSSLCSNIEHIKEIVAMQQAYARVAGLQESLHATDLMEDAMRMNAGAVERHRIQVTREYSALPPILVDKHKVLQILVNLIRNAKYALEDQVLGDKQMILRAEPGENGTVKIYIIDNGVGIAVENMARIFEHGFTTRKNGHGFALHSGALAAREMGGTLTCQSAGPGQGAVFILELPLRPPEENA
jgi:signal transduction histidine kinase